MLALGRSTQTRPMRCRVPGNVHVAAHRWLLVY